MNISDSNKNPLAKSQRFYLNILNGIFPLENNSCQNINKPIVLIPNSNFNGNKPDLFLIGKNKFIER